MFIFMFCALSALLRVDMCLVAIIIIIIIIIVNVIIFFFAQTGQRESNHWISKLKRLMDHGYRKEEAEMALRKHNMHFESALSKSNLFCRT